jgi:uncharacterized protein (DUF1499 family)
LAFFLLSALLGSTPSDFPDSSRIESPFSPCPDSPNCVIHTVGFDHPADQLFDAVQIALEKMNPHKIHADSQSLQIDAVFRIAVFGFKDDVEMFVESADNQKSILHIKSASRVGYSDLGVNRRRVKRIIKKIQQNIKNK